MKRYLLPCPCSRTIEVAASQAGGSVRCPGCGAQRPVPRLGRLARFEVATTAAPTTARRAWGAAQACFLAGVVVAAAGTATAGWLHARRSALATLTDERMVVESVAAASADRVYEAWRAYERQGIARLPLPEEQWRWRYAESLAALERVAWAGAAAGAGLAAVAAVVVAAGRRGRRG